MYIVSGKVQSTLRLSTELHEQLEQKCTELMCTRTVLIEYCLSYMIDNDLINSESIKPKKTVDGDEVKREITRLHKEVERLKLLTDKPITLHTPDKSNNKVAPKVRKSIDVKLVKEELNTLRMTILSDLEELGTVIKDEMGNGTGLSLRSLMLQHSKESAYTWQYFVWVYDFESDNQLLTADEPLNVSFQPKDYLPVDHYTLVIDGVDKYLSISK